MLANYSCVINNPATAAFAASTTAALTVVPPGGAFESAVITAVPAHPLPIRSMTRAIPRAAQRLPSIIQAVTMAFTAPNAQNGFDGVNGPNSRRQFFLAFPRATMLFHFTTTANLTMSRLSVAPWNLNTNTVTITAWINPNNTFEGTNATLVVNHGAGTDVEGLIFNTSGNSTLGYEWNNDVNNASWDSGLLPPAGQWSFVAPGRDTDQRDD